MNTTVRSIQFVARFSKYIIYINTVYHRYTYVSIFSMSMVRVCPIAVFEIAVILL